MHFRNAAHGNGPSGLVLPPHALVAFGKVKDDGERIP